MDYDAAFQRGCSPTETLLMSVAGCLAIDAVSFMQKMRAEITSFKIDYSGERNLAPPQYYKSMGMIINASGKGITPKKIERAISLSQEKYCSVYHPLRKDSKVDVKYNITDEN